jgi:hypothetical protein
LWSIQINVPILIKNIFEISTREKRARKHVNYFPFPRIRYGEIDKVNLIISFLKKVKNALKSDEVSEFIMLCEVEESRIRFHLTRLSEEEIIDPHGPYHVDSKKIICFNCAQDILDDSGNWTHFSPATK